MEKMTQVKSNTGVVAIIALRNEAPYLETCLSYLELNSIEVIVIDNESTDKSLEIANDFLNRNVLKIYNFPFPGYFDWTGLLTFKNTIRKEIKADWIIHQDADEIIKSSVPNESLFDCIKRIESQNFNCINLEEFVFLPVSENDVTNFSNYIRDMRHYYYFAPSVPRLMRIYKNSLDASNVERAGHRFPISQVNLSSEFLELRHYIALSWEHFLTKYKNRIYSEAELEKDWHWDRNLLKSREFKIPELNKLQYLEDENASLSKEVRYTKNFWLWK